MLRGAWTGLKLENGELALGGHCGELPPAPHIRVGTSLLH